MTPVIKLTQWPGVGTPPAGDVLVPDVFGGPFMPTDAEVLAGEQSMQVVEAVFARIAAHPEQSFWLATEHVGRAAEWFGWLCDSPAWPELGIEAGELPSVPGYTLTLTAEELFDRDFDEFPWPLPNLTLLSKPADLGALLELPAARHGVVVSSAENAAAVRHRRQACIAGHCVDINGDWWHEPGKCPGAPMNCSGKCCYADPGAVLLSGDWWRCPRCGGNGTHGYRRRIDPDIQCLDCRGRCLTPGATALVESCRAAGVEVARA